MAGRCWALRPVFRQCQVVREFLCSLPINKCSPCSPIMDTVRRPSTSAMAGFPSPQRPIWKFFAQSSGLYAPLFSRKSRPYMRHLLIESQIILKIFFVKLTRFNKKKFDSRFQLPIAIGMLGIKNAAPDNIITYFFIKINWLRHT